MKRFSFSLQSILEYRSRLENVLSVVLAAAQVQSDEEKKVLDKWRLLQNDCQAELATKTVQGMTIVERIHYQQYLDMIADSMRIQKQRIQEAFLRVEQARNKLMEVAQKKKVLERLKQNKFKDYQQDIDHWEQSFLDEISRNRLVR